MENQSGTYRVGNAWLSREIRIDDGDIHTVALHIASRADLALSTREVALVLDAAEWRHDIPQWRWTKSGPRGEDAGYHQMDFDDTGWAVVPHLLPIFDALYDGWAWFRHEFSLPTEYRSQPVTIVVGGMDDEDWTQYRVFLNGVPVAEHCGSGRWREPLTIVLQPDDERHGCLRFGDRNLLALEVKDLRRERLDMVPGERDHYMFNSLLLDQFIAVGPPYTIVGDFAVTAVRAGGENPWLARLDVEMIARSHPGLGVTISYTASPAGPCLRKAVTVHNRGTEPVQLLDLILEDWQGAFAAEHGGRGEPCLAGSFFCGVEHPAGIAMGDEGWLKAVQLPGQAIAPGESFASEPVVVGVGLAGRSIEQAFREYLVELRPRKHKRLVVYDALGWYDYTFLAAEPLTELSEALVEENLRLLADLRDKGVVFDAYMLDDWWEHTDLAQFRRSTFPHGGAAIRQSIEEVGLRPGLWFATTCAGWTCDRAPGMDAATSGGTGMSPIVPLTDRAEKPDWVELFTNANVRDKRFCLAAEPYRSMVRQIIPRHVSELGLACLKLDCVTLHCTASDHGHRPGKYSVEAMADVVLDTVAAAQRENPDLMVIWYWGFRSPWWLKYGDVAFDKGLKMEAASPASAPAPSYRQSVTLNVDQAIRHAGLLPLPLQDSLGVWLGHVAWANRMGKEEWRDAFLLDSARGSPVIQLWGDLGLLDGDDVAFLADVLRWLRSTEQAFRSTTSVGGDPWRAEAYGYAQRSDNGALLTLYNPGYAAATVPIDPASLGVLTDQALSAYEIYPFPGVLRDPIAGESDGAMLAIPLKPFELRCLQLQVGGASSGSHIFQERPPTRASSRLELTLVEAPPAASDSVPVRTQHSTGSIVLPEIVRHDHLTLVVRLHRHGEWWYHPEPQSLVQLTCRLNGLDVHCTVAPRSRSYNGPGSPWVVYDCDAGSSWTGQELRIDLHAQLPDGIAVSVEAYRYDAWWLHHKKRFLPGE